MPGSSQPGSNWMYVLSVVQRRHAPHFVIDQGLLLDTKKKRSDGGGKKMAMRGPVTAAALYRHWSAVIRFQLFQAPPKENGFSSFFVSCREFPAQLQQSRWRTVEPSARLSSSGKQKEKGSRGTARTSCSLLASFSCPLETCFLFTFIFAKEVVTYSFKKKHLEDKMLFLSLPRLVDDKSTAIVFSDPPDHNKPAGCF